LRVKAFHNPYVVAIARVWVGCFSLFMLVIALKYGFTPDAWENYFGPNPWRPLIGSAQVALSLALAAVAFGVSRRWLRVLLALPIISGILYLVYAWIFQATIGQFEWTFALVTGAVYGIPLVLSLLLLSDRRATLDLRFSRHRHP
jgi:hypothetical protein